MTHQREVVVQDLEALKVAVAQICANRAHVHLLLDEPELALDDSCKALEAVHHICVIR